MYKFISLIPVVCVLAACSSNNVIENSAYLESKTLPPLAIPADLAEFSLNSIYPIPALDVSVMGKTPEELETLKSPPDLLGL